ncbi:MAG TPA: L-histidine N(alpha)-methyltransferase [Streptomyces sp.]
MSPFLLTRLQPATATAAALRADVLRGLTRRPKSLPPKWFYDEHGSQLFEKITTLPDYYPTRAERALLLAHGATIAAETGARTLIDLGSGSSQKTQHLLDAMPGLDTYVPVDVSESALAGAGGRLAEQRPGLNIHGLIGDFTAGLALPGTPGPRLVAVLGSTIGNLLPLERTMLLSSIHSLLTPDDALLLGTDLVKDDRVLTAAYDDTTGVTAEFNKNLLTVLNRELDADFDLDAFDHVARWDQPNEWIEMRLRSRTAQTVKIPALDLTVHFAAGEELRTEVSAKFRHNGVRRELAEAGMELTHWWNVGRLYALTLATPRTLPDSPALPAEPKAGGASRTSRP